MAYRAILAVLLIILTACNKAPSHGIVTDADYTAAWVQFIPGNAPTSSCDSKGRCTSTAGTPDRFIPWPAKWELEITNEKNESGWREVTQLDYERCNLLEKFPECTDPKSGDAR